MAIGLKPEEFVPFASDEVGVEVRAHHCRTGHGKDKMYVRRDPDGIRAYCHHCNRGGFAPSGESTERSKEPAGGSERGYAPRHSHFSYPRTVPIDFANEYARDWLGRYLTSKDFHDVVIEWDPERDELVLPVFHGDGIAAYQTRRFPGGDGPKYYTHRKPDYTHHAAFHRGGDKYRHRVVLVEDIVSAWKVSTVMPALPLLGTNLTNNQRAYILEMFTEAVVWLDNDNPQVELKATDLVLNLSQFIPTGCIFGWQDPKAVDTEVIRFILTGGTDHGASDSSRTAEGAVRSEADFPDKELSRIAGMS